MEKQIKEERLNDENNVLKILSKLVSIPSYEKIGKYHQIIEYLKYSFRDCCEILEVEDSNGYVHLLVGVNCELKDIEDSILLSGHIDTVRESEGHSCNVSLEVDKLSGLGVSDMKSFIAILIANINYLRSLDIPLVISVTSDEETNLLGIRRIIQELKIRNINPGLTIVGEPTNLDYYASSRGNSIYVSVMNGVAAHSGTPELGVNAIELIAEFITAIKKISKQYEKEAAVCITAINGGKSPSNVVPDECSICFGIRTSDFKVLDAMYSYLLTKHKEISQCYGESKLFNVLSIPPFERRKSEFFIKQCDVNGKKMIDANYSTEAGYIQEAYPDANIIIYGPGNPDCIHKAGEGITVNNLFRYEVELIEMINSYLDYRKLDKKGIKKLIYRPKK